MKCACCEREIKEDERFYEFDDEFYCDSCVEEEYITLYRINGSESYYEQRLQRLEQQKRRVLAEE